MVDKLQRYQSLMKLPAEDNMWKAVWLLGAQCCMAAKYGILYRCAEDNTKFGGNWPDPTKFAPPDINPMRY